MDRLSIPEPSLIDIADRSGLDEQEMHAFAQRWTELLDSIDDASAVGINYMPVMSTEMESLIWEKKTSPAWVTNRDLRMRLMPVFYQRLRPAFLLMDEELGQPADVKPRINERDDDDLWQRAALRVLAWAMSMPDALVVDAGIEGTESMTLTVHTEPGREREASVCHGHEDFVHILPIRELCETVDASKLGRLIELAVEHFISENPERSVEYRMEFDGRFLDQFADSPRELKAHIVDAIVSRVTQDQKSAQADKGLKDEPISSAGERRMRVTRDWRIHYVYVDGPGMRFISVGKHDLGLKK